MFPAEETAPLGGAAGAAPAAARGTGAALVGLVLLAVALSAAISVDVVRDGYGVKSDEATYVAMALSLAYDHDLVYERRDLERFVGLYRAGPSGIFLKRGKQLRVRLNAKPPFVRLLKSPDTRNDRLYFAKAMLYPMAAAPFVRLFGLNGLLVLNVLLMAGACACGYAFLSARSPAAPSLLFTLAFVAATCVPVYLVMLAPEILNFTLVFVAYFLWLYKEVAPATASRLLRGWGSDVAAAALLGAVTYSKPSHALLILPIVLWYWWRRHIVGGLFVGSVCVAAAAGGFGMSALHSGEFNYQGGDRKTFIGSFPFDASIPSAWDQAAEFSTNDSDSEAVLSDFTNRFAHNLEYFFVGRHSGFLPYFFPGAVAAAAWLMSRERTRPWRAFIGLALAGTVAGLLIFFPYTWNGGGGPYGNRYFMSAYAATFFLMPPIATSAPAVAAWVVGALFTAKALIAPFYAAKFPYLMAERGFVRSLPVEVTMANDLPIALDAPRAHIWFSDVLMYFLDKHSYVPEVVNEHGDKAIWVAGDGRADILVRCEWPIDHLSMTLVSPIKTTFTVSMGGPTVRVPLLPGQPAKLDVPAAGVYGLKSYAYLMAARSSDGFTPRLQSAASTDDRNLGVLMRFKAVPVAGYQSP